VFIKPLEAAFGWDRGSISFAVAVSLLAYGLGATVATRWLNAHRGIVLGGLGAAGMGFIAPALAIRMTTQPPRAVSQAAAE